MRILLLGCHMNYNMEHYVYINLKKLGHEVEFYGYKERIGRLANPVRMVITRSKVLRSLADVFWLNRIDEEIKKLAEKWRPVLVLSIKGVAIKSETIEWIKQEIGAKAALWYPDDPRFFDSLAKHIAPHYDYVFTCSERSVEMYREEGAENVYYMPFACEPSIHRKVNLSDEELRKFKNDVCFVGTYYPRRAKIIKRLERNGFKVSVWGPYWRYFSFGDDVHDAIYGPEMVKVLNAAKIVLNIHDEDDLIFKANMRVFEATGCGSFLLTDKPYGLEKLFDTEREVVCYGSENELIDLTKYYLNESRERVAIANEGQERAYKEHTYDHRVRKMLSVVG